MLEVFKVQNILVNFWCLVEVAVWLEFEKRFLTIMHNLSFCTVLENFADWVMDWYIPARDFFTYFLSSPTATSLHHSISIFDTTLEICMKTGGFSASWTSKWKIGKWINYDVNVRKIRHVFRIPNRFLKFILWKISKSAIFIWKLKTDFAKKKFL